MKARSVGLSLSLAMLALAGADPAARAGGPDDSIVRVTSVMRYPNPVRPWAKQNPMDAGGTGVVIDGKRILTVAHLVQYAEEVYVQPGQGGDKVEAKVAAIAPGIDLAVLTVDSSEGEFFENRAAAAPRRRAAGRLGPRGRQGVPDRRHRAVDHAGHRLADRVRLLRHRVAGPAHPGRCRDQPGQQRRAGAGQRQDGGPGLGRRGGRERRVPHPQRGDRGLPQGRRRRPVRRQADPLRAVADARERGAAGEARAGQVRARDRGPRTAATRRVLPAQGVRRRDRDRRQGDRQRGDGAGRRQPAAVVPLPGAQAGARRHGADPRGPGRAYAGRPAAGRPRRGPPDPGLRGQAAVVLRLRPPGLLAGHEGRRLHLLSVQSRDPQPQHPDLDPPQRHGCSSPARSWSSLPPPCCRTG